MKKVYQTILRWVNHGLPTDLIHFTKLLCNCNSEQSIKESFDLMDLLWNNCYVQLIGIQMNQLLLEILINLLPILYKETIFRRGEKVPAMHGALKVMVSASFFVWMQLDRWF